MLIRKLRTNHIEKPIGYALEPLTLSWIPESTGKKQVSARVKIALDQDFKTIVYDSGDGQLDSIAYYPDIELEPRTRYYWNVEVIADNGDQGYEESYFETGKMDEEWQGNWIKPPFEEMPLIIKTINVEHIESARIYMVGLGVYELYCNGAKVSKEYLAPGFHSYDLWLQSYTYDLTPYLSEGLNTIGLMLGNGWYKGPLGWKGIEAKPYGEELLLKAEIHLKSTNGESSIICSDDTWLCHRSPVLSNSIYYGEDYDARLEVKDWSMPSGDHSKFEPALIHKNSQNNIQDRLSLPMHKFEVFEPKIIHTPKGEVVLDFGQNHAGWVEGDVHLPRGSKVKLEFGELLQNDCFYRDNLRTAEAQYTYISNGELAHFRPHFTFYGYRFVKVEGITDEEALMNFRAYAIYSALDTTGEIITSNNQVNQVISNASWGLKSNFVDVPTDCPQRDERVGWTGDTQAFSGTASFNMHTAAFYTKYMRDLRLEQDNLDGGVPFVVPLIKTDNKNAIISKHSSCAWGDVATILPWTLYEYYGDIELLRSQYKSMKDWVDYIIKVDEASGNKRLWTTGFHFADWLALDNHKDPLSPFGKTDQYYVASAYYAYSASLVSKAAKVLGYSEDSDYYIDLSNEVKAAILKEYYSPNGRCVSDTQTAKVIGLYMDLVPAEFKERLVHDLERQLKDNHGYLDTGFVGTTYLCKTLSQYGLNDLAYTLLLNEEMPSWIYEVNMGATTIWERWNSVLPDGSLNPQGMNSMNHYTYGSVLEWMYRYMCGIKPSEDKVGFRSVTIEPMIDPRIKYVKCWYESPIGTYKSAWEIKDLEVVYKISVPFNGSAVLIIDGREETVYAGEYTITSLLPNKVGR